MKPVSVCLTHPVCWILVFRSAGLECVFSRIQYIYAVFAGCADTVITVTDDDDELLGNRGHVEEM